MSLTAAQQLERRSGLGASEAAAAIGLSPWETPLVLWRKKLGIASPEEIERDELHLEMGQVLEPLIVNRFERKQKVQVVDRQLKIIDAANPWRWVTLDGRSLKDGAHIEAKSVGFADPKEWGDEMEDNAVPMHYYIQCQHGLACNPAAPYAWLPMVVLNRQFRIYRIQREPELIALMTEQERAFMDCVESKTAPPPIDMDDTKLLWPSHIENKAVEADDELANVVLEFKHSKAKIKEIQATQDELKLTIQRHMGDAAELVYAGKKICTWRKAKDGSKFDTDRFSADHPELYAKYLNKVIGSRRMLTP